MLMKYEAANIGFYGALNLILTIRFNWVDCNLPNCICNIASCFTSKTIKMVKTKNMSRISFFFLG